MSSLSVTLSDLSPELLLLVAQRVPVTDRMQLCLVNSRLQKAAATATTSLEISSRRRLSFRKSFRLWLKRHEQNVLQFKGVGIIPLFDLPSTNLQHLHLESCIMQPSSLQAALKAATALTYLHMSSFVLKNDAEQLYQDPLFMLSSCHQADMQRGPPLTGQTSFLDLQGSSTSA